MRPGAIVAGLRLPEVGGDKTRRKKFDTYPTRLLPYRLAEVRIAEGKLYLFVAHRPEIK